MKLLIKSLRCASQGLMGASHRISWYLKSVSSHKTHFNVDKKVVNTKCISIFIEKQGEKRFFGHPSYLKVTTKFNRKLHSSTKLGRHHNWLHFSKNVQRQLANNFLLAIIQGFAITHFAQIAFNSGWHLQRWRFDKQSWVSKVESKDLGMGNSNDFLIWL